jgi:hypothetical protein
MVEEFEQDKLIIAGNNYSKLKLIEEKLSYGSETEKKIIS